jgi:di/tricarboxylate transporter
MFLIDPTYLMWVTLLLAVAAITLYALERIPLELTSIGLLAALLVVFHLFPVQGPGGENLLGPGRLLAGFANPALIAVLALLVIGQGMIRTGVLDRAAQVVFRIGGGNLMPSLGLALALVMVISAVINNTPVVVIFIPIMQALAERFGQSTSTFMMPLSFAAILGGMTTLIGSSTNLLVSSSLIELGREPFSFFTFTVPGLVLAAIGLIYVLLVAPRILPDRATLAGALVGESGKQFIAQISVPEGSKLVGEKAVAGMFPTLRDVTVRLIQRGEHGELPPFDGFALRASDVLIVAATRKALTDAVARGVGVLQPELRRRGRREETKDEPWPTGNQIVAEAMVTPASRLIGQNLEQIGFRHRYRCLALGIQRRSRMIRARMTEIPLEPGDVLLVQGTPEDVQALRANRDILPMEWSQTDVPSPELTLYAFCIFLGVVGLAASGIVPIVVAALLGAAAMIFIGGLNIRQAARAIDRRIVLLVAAALGLGTAMQATGAAAFLANAVIDLFGASHPAAVLSAFFLATALMTNVLSNNACAVLFTPIAVSLAEGLGIDPMIFAVAVVFAANCSFASPIGYQTNLLVMGPGHYRFVDFVRVGMPLTLLLWVSFTIFAPLYYGL